MPRSARDIAGYRLVAGLGEGGMARVYLALSRKAAGFSKLVVLKVLRSSTLEDPDLRRMFFDEARIAALLNHPNVVQTYEAGEDEGRLFLAMEYLEGKSLATILTSVPREKLPLDVHLRIIADMLEGLHYAHGVDDIDGTPLRIIHRDVSPQNVIVTFAGQSKVVDFGIAKISGAPNTESGVIKGKAGYMSPEQIHNANVDHRADVFAAGVMIWEAIAGRRLVQRGEDDVVVLARRMQGEDPSVRTVAPRGTPEELLAICDRAMCPGPAFRYASAQELHDALDGYLRKTGGADQKRVAAFLQEHFGDERKKTRSFIEEQMRAADESKPLVDISKQRAVNPPSVPPVPAVPTASSYESPTKTAHMTSVVPRQARPPNLVPVFIAGGVVATIGIVLAVIATNARRTAHTATAASTSAVASVAPVVTTAPTASGEPAPALAHLVVRTNAPAATLKVDDEAQSFPYEAKVARGTTVHLTAHAPGFVDYDREVTVDEDMTLEIAFSPRAPLDKSKKKRAIDDGDPYRR